METCSSTNNHTPFSNILTPQTLLCNSKFWFASAVVFVYLFSVSGAIYNIITNAPMFVVHPSDPHRIVFFYEGTLMQLGAEGFAVGFLFTVVGLLLALLTHVLVNVRNVSQQRVMTIFALFICYYCVNKVVYLVSWKTFYPVHAFWTSTWN